MIGKNMIRVFTSLVAIFSIAPLLAQATTGEVPKLVVTITVDQLRGDYLEMFRHTFGNKGFNRLLSSGLVYRNVRYNYPNPDRASSITTLFTGAYPSYHGITGEKRYQPETGQEISSFTDDRYLGNFTTEKLSPRPIKVSTLTDELKIASGGQSDVFAFAPYASQALSLRAGTPLVALTGLKTPAENGLRPLFIPTNSQRWINRIAVRSRSPSPSGA